MAKISAQKEKGRILRRSWHLNKAYLPKYSSLPELQLMPHNRPLFLCIRCGFTNTVIPMCLWCTWASEEAEHAFESSMPRARRASAPARVFLQIYLQRDPPNTRPHDRPSNTDKVTSCKTSLGQSSSTRKATCRPMPSPPLARSKDLLQNLTNSGADVMISPDGKQIYEQMAMTADVVKATSWTSPAESEEFAEARAPRKGEGQPTDLDKESFDTDDGQERQELDPVFKWRTGAASEVNQTEPSSVDRSDPNSTSMTVTKPSRQLKATRRNVVIDLNDTKRLSLSRHRGHDHTHEQQDAHGGTCSSPSSPISSKPSSPVSPRHPQLRTLRRKNERLNVVRTCSNPESVPVEPIAISLTLHSSTTSPKSPKSSTIPIPPNLNNTHLRRDSEPESITSTSDSLTTARTSLPSPLLPEGLSPSEQTPPPSSPSSAQSTPFPTSAPTPTPIPDPAPHPISTPTNVRLGHPNRPYYSAIRKQGISPPSSRPSSVTGFANPSPSLSPKNSPTTIRPRSYNPAPPPRSAPALSGSPSATRHLSMSAMPPSSSGFFSVFALSATDSDGEVDGREDEDEVPNEISAPAPIERMSFGFSLADAAKRLSRQKSTSFSYSHPPSAFVPPNHHAHSQSLTHPSWGLPPSAAHPHPHHHPSQSLSTLSSATKKTSGFRMSSPSPGFGGLAHANGVGFSMSGETELRMALALAEAHSDGPVDGSDDAGRLPISTATAPSSSPSHEDLSLGLGLGLSRPLLPLPPPPISSPPLYIPSSSRPGMDPAKRKSFMGRVKKLRKGLKDMLLMNTHANDTTTTMDANTSTTTTAATTTLTINTTTTQSSNMPLPSPIFA